MHGPFNYVLIGLGSAMTMISFVIALELPTQASQSSVFQPTQVNRTLKGDRLPVMPGAHSESPVAPRLEPKLPDGCVAKYDARVNIFHPEVAGRCVV